MGKEIERKYLVADTSWKTDSQPEQCRQGYICPGTGKTVRVRVKSGKGYLTFKDEGEGISRREYEFEVPIADAEEMLEYLCEKPLIEKDRYTIEYEGMSWEVDEFKGENEGLIVAEVELEKEDQLYSLPKWIGKEVTGDPRFYNVALVKNPFSKWKRTL